MASYTAPPAVRSTSRPRPSAGAGAFCSARGVYPSTEAIDAALACVGFDAVDLDRARQTVRFLRPGIELNLGAIGKGYALDRVAADMRGSGVTDALLSAGRSSLLAIGGEDAGWHVDVVSARRDEAAASRPLARVWLRDAALGTSGSGEQFVVADGSRYGHVIDPRTGWPAAGVLSVSVIASSAAVADALSTAFLVGGAELAERYCAEHPSVMAIVTPEDRSEMRSVVCWDGQYGEAIARARGCSDAAARASAEVAGARSASGSAWGWGPKRSKSGAPRAVINADRNLQTSMNVPCRTL